MPNYPNGIGSELTNAECTQYYNAAENILTLAELRYWVQSQPTYRWMTDEVFYLCLGWSEGEGYFYQSIQGSYLCGCCAVNNSYHSGATDYASFKAAMYLPDVPYYSYAQMMSRGQNPSSECLKIMTMAFANPQPQASLFYGEYEGWVPADYIPYSPLCYDGSIQIWCIPVRSWTFPTSGTGVRDWTPGPGPTPWSRYPFRKRRRRAFI